MHDCPLNIKLNALHMHFTSANLESYNTWLPTQTELRQAMVRHQPYPRRLGGANVVTMGKGHG